jgi:hypothetical protein
MDRGLRISIRFDYREAFDKLLKRLGLYLFSIDHRN